MKGYIDLHAHLDGSINVDIAKKLARLQGITLPTDDDNKLSSLLSISDSCRDLNDFLKCFELPLTLLQTEAGIKEAVYLILENMREDGVIYSEIRFAPQLHTKGGLSQEKVIRAAIEGLRKSKIPGNLILCCMRGDKNERENRLTVELAHEYLSKNEGVVAIDLAGAEAVYPTKNFISILKLASSYDIPMTIHAGEAGSAEDIKVAIEMGARRIGHGVRAYEDENVMRLIKDKGIYLEMCPTSNYYTKAVPDMREYPLLKFLNMGIKVTVNTDDMAIVRMNLSKEFKYIEDLLGLTDMQKEVIFNNSLEASFASRETKERLISV